MNNDGTQVVHDARECTNYAGVDLTRHTILKEAYTIACLIEACGASPQLTTASSAAFDFITTLHKTLQRFEAERDAWKMIARGRYALLKEHGIVTD